MLPQFAWPIVLTAVAVEASWCNPKTFASDKDTTTNSYRSVKAVSQGDCCNHCSQDVRCGHFVFVPPLDEVDGLVEAAGECNLKEGGIHDYTDRVGYVVGQPPVAPKPRLPLLGPHVPSPPGPPAPGPLPGPALGYQPHIIYMLADDVGHYNMGWRGNKEARTPNMDALVSDGLILDHMYTYKYCSPTRSALLSGRLPIHVNEANRGPTEKGGIDLRMTIVAEKMKAAGYATHQVGKWNVGSLAWGQMPIERGFDSSFGYMGGEEDHYSQEGAYKVNGSKMVDLWDNDQPAYGKNGTYNAFHFEERAVGIIQAHDPSVPLFMYLAWQNAHTPNQVPDSFLGPVLKDDRDDHLRQTYNAMVYCLDSAIGNVTDALKAKGMWKKTLVIFSSDNGGREDGHFGGNNFPLRGMKFSDFEGGVRVTSWASGGIIPKHRRGSTEAGLIHICDWYATFCALAGADPWDSKAADAGLPPVDGMNMWPMLASGVASPRSVFALSSSAVISWPHKLVLGTQGGKGWWTSHKHPNSTMISKNQDPGCPEGCVFDISADPEERTDLAPSSPKLRKKLSSLLDAYIATKFQTEEIPGYDNCVTIEEYAAEHAGFGGPLCNRSSTTFLL